MTWSRIEVDLVERIARASFDCWRKRMDEQLHHLDKGRNFEDMDHSEREFALMHARVILNEVGMFFREFVK